MIISSEHNISVQNESYVELGIGLFLSLNLAYYLVIIVFI